MDVVKNILKRQFGFDITNIIIDELLYYIIDELSYYLWKTKFKQSLVYINTILSHYRHSEFVLHEISFCSNGVSRMSFNYFTNNTNYDICNISLTVGSDGIIKNISSIWKKMNNIYHNY